MAIALSIWSDNNVSAEEKGVLLALHTIQGPCRETGTEMAAGHLLTRNREQQVRDALIEQLQTYSDVQN